MSKALIPFFLFVLIHLQSYGQSEIKDAIVSVFAAPYEQISIKIDDEEFTFRLLNNTQILKKNKAIAANTIFPGARVNLTHKIISRKRYAIKIDLIASIETGKVKFTGVYELPYKEAAFVDGRFVQLSDQARIKCAGTRNCECSSGVEYLSFSELKAGYFLTISGIQAPGGVVIANEVLVCKNKQTKIDQEIRLSAEQQFNGGDLQSIEEIPPDLYVPPFGLYQGTVEIGELAYEVRDDVELQSYVNEVGQKLIPAYAKEPGFAEKHQVYFRFYVIDNPIPNAFAYPNGMIFIHTGLINIMDNEAQLATVLGHEIAHVTYEHASNRQKSMQIMENEVVSREMSNLGNMAKDLIKDFVRENVKVKDPEMLDAAIEGASRAIGKTTASDIANIFSKSKETQADRVGMFYMYAAGYDLREVASFWKKMSEVTKDKTFMSRLVSDSHDILVANEGNLGKDFIKGMGDQGTEMIISNMLESIYTSHPRTKDRFFDTQGVLSTTYRKANFERSEKGAGRFMQAVGHLR